MAGSGFKLLFIGNCELREISEEQELWADGSQLNLLLGVRKDRELLLFYKKYLCGYRFEFLKSEKYMEFIWIFVMFWNLVIICKSEIKSKKKTN